MTLDNSIIDNGDLAYNRILKGKQSRIETLNIGNHNHNYCSWKRDSVQSLAENKDSVCLHRERREKRERYTVELETGWWNIVALYPSIQQ